MPNVCHWSTPGERCFPPPFHKQFSIVIVKLRQISKPDLLACRKASLSLPPNFLKSHFSIRRFNSSFASVQSGRGRTSLCLPLLPSSDPGFVDRTKYSPRLGTSPAEFFRNSPVPRRLFPILDFCSCSSAPSVLGFRLAASCFVALRRSPSEVNVAACGGIDSWIFLVPC